MMETPTGWSISPLIDAIDKMMDFRGRTPKKLGMEWGGGGIKAISARNVRMGYLDFAVEHYLASETLYRKWMTHGDMRAGDILFTTEAPLGNVALVPDNQRYVLSQRTVLMRVNANSLDEVFFACLLQSPLFQQTLVDNATGSTALGIQRARLERLPIVLPPVPEQRRIGRVLQDVEKLVASIERLIAKKREVKQGLMQELLTGQTRLPGFSGVASTLRLGDVATFSKGAGLPKSIVGPVGEFQCVHYGELFLQYPTVGETTISRTNWNGPAKSRVGDVLMPTSDVTPRGLAKATALLMQGVVLGGDILVIRVNQSLVDSSFLAYAIRNDARQVLDMVRGSTVYHLYARDMGAFEISVPSLKEQRAIAQVLRDADDEISTLERRLESARAIKQGMMQELLTGRTRLVTEAAA